MRTLIIWCNQSNAGELPSILQASRIMKKLEQQGSQARFAIGDMHADDAQNIFVVCKDFKGSDFDVERIQREFNCKIMMDVFGRATQFIDGEWQDLELYWYADPVAMVVVGKYQAINGDTRYLCRDFAPSCNDAVCIAMYGVQYENTRNYGEYDYIEPQHLRKVCCT